MAGAIRWAFVFLGFAETHDVEVRNQTLMFDALPRWEHLIFTQRTSAIRCPLSVVTPGRGRIGSLRHSVRCGRSQCSSGIFVERCRAWRQLNPWVSTAVVDRNARRWKVRVSKRTYGYAHRLIVTVFGMEDSSPANRAEPEYELGSFIPDSNVLGGGTEDFERSGEARQCCKDTAGPLLAGEAVANANSSWFAFDLNAQLSAGASGCSERL
jgi:hypothetical protein